MNDFALTTYVELLADGRFITANILDTGSKLVCSALKQFLTAAGKTIVSKYRIAKTSAA
jgi:hypothetical protein